MGSNVIVSEETLRDLLEAHAALSAWYYQLWAALRAANATAAAPDDAARAAFVERLAAEFPELAAVARTIETPRAYVPAPPPTRALSTPAPAIPTGDRETLLEPASARALAELEIEVEPFDAVSRPASIPAPPALVDPAAVKYGGGQ